jgi:hypothetical protein
MDLQNQIFQTILEIIKQGGNFWGNWLGGLSSLQPQQGLPDSLLSQGNFNGVAQLGQSQLLNAFSLERAKDLLINGGSISETEHYFRKFKDKSESRIANLKITINFIENYSK